jgi:hypothetical protein
MERSVIRDQPIPDYAALHPGYQAAASFAPLTQTGLSLMTFTT